MATSAAFMAALGLATSFLPQEILAHLGTRADAANTLILQIVGALWFGFALLNWSARGNLIGGIYSRPIALGNFVHFAMVSITLIKLISADAAPYLLVGTACYALLAIGFGLVLFGGAPAQKD